MTIHQMWTDQILHGQPLDTLVMTLRMTEQGQEQEADEMALFTQHCCLSI